MQRLYLIPARGVTAQTGVKYLASRQGPPIPGLEGIAAGMISYGSQPLWLVGADTTDFQHTLLLSQSDVLAFPSDLDSLVSATTVSVWDGALKAAFIPTTRLTTSITYRALGRIIGNMFRFLIDYRLVGGSIKLFGGSTRLTSTWSSLTQAEQEAINYAASQLQIDLSSVQSNTTLAELLEIIITAMESRPVLLGLLQL